MTCSRVNFTFTFTFLFNDAVSSSDYRALEDATGCTAKWRDVGV